MDAVVQAVLPNGEIMLVLNHAPVFPQLGDLMPGPDGTVYQVVQRAYIIEKPETKLTVVGKEPDKGRIVIQCVITPVSKEDAECNQPLN